MARTVFLDDVYRLASKALAAGAERVSTGVVRWNIAGNCTAPHTSRFFARPSRGNDTKWIVVKKTTAIPFEVILETRCRRCDNCTRYRSRLWAARASSEIQGAPRTWFGTLTLSPERQYEALTRASVKALKRGYDLAELPMREQQMLVNAAISPEITKFLKRVRSSTGPFRYCCVCETHQSGDLHYHILVHEVTEFSISWRDLSSQWRMGFSRFKLVSGAGKAAWYCAKYLAKSSVARVRASEDYGNPPVGIVPRMGDVKVLRPRDREHETLTAT